jgi:CHAD domain-containing protein
VARPTPVPGLRPGSPCALAGSLVLAARLADVRRYEEGVAALDADAIHDMRVATRRLRAALKLFGGAGARQVDRDVKRLQDALGDVRDVQVQLEWLASVARRLTRAEAARMRAWIAAPLARGEPALRRALRRWTATTAADVERAAAASRRRGRLGGRKMARRLSRRERQAARLAASVRDDPRPSAAHELRIAAKKLRYAAEPLEPAFPSRVERLLAALVPLQETLGELHDADVRIERLRRLARRGAPPERRAARKLLSALEPRRERLAAALVRELPALSGAPRSPRAS